MKILKPERRILKRHGKEEMIGFYTDTVEDNSSAEDLSLLAEEEKVVEMKEIKLIKNVKEIEEIEENAVYTPWSNDENIKNVERDDNGEIYLQKVSGIDNNISSVENSYCDSLTPTTTDTSSPAPTFTLAVPSAISDSTSSLSSSLSSVHSDDSLFNLYL